MRATINRVWLLGGTVIAMCFVASSQSVDARGPRDARVSGNPCASISLQKRDLTAGYAKDFATDSLYGDLRAELALSVWIEDSVAATVDSVVCTHVDSLISVWLATPAADSLNVVRPSYWTSLAVVRINPGKYFAKPPIEVDYAAYNFVVDSVSGNVRFFRTAY